MLHINTGMVWDNEIMGSIIVQYWGYLHRLQVSLAGASVVVAMVLAQVFVIYFTTLHITIEMDRNSSAEDFPAHC